jgi:CHASE2 domain-containing sensor protein
MTKYLILFVGLIFTLGCTEKESVTITIVDIGHLDRVGIAKELRIINKYSPRVIGLDFLLTYDSLEKDNQLVDAISKANNLVITTMLHNNDPNDITKWDSLEQYHEKFKFNAHGFSNLTITDDSVIVHELPMRQYYRDEIEFAFSYMVANKYDSDKINSKYKNEDKDFSFDKGSFGHYFKVVSIKDLMMENFDKSDITDKIVLMGHISNTENSFYMDDKRTKKISGTEIQASVIREIMD